MSIIGRSKRKKSKLFPNCRDLPYEEENSNGYQNSRTNKGKLVDDSLGDLIFAQEETDRIEIWPVKVITDQKIIKEIKNRVNSEPYRQLVSFTCSDEAELTKAGVGTRKAIKALKPNLKSKGRRKKY